MLMRAPVRLDDIYEWDARVASADGVKRGDARRHVERLCNTAAFGRWAYAMAEDSGWSPPKHVVTAIRKAFNRASWKRKCRGIVQALGRRDDGSLPIRVAQAGAFSDDILTILVHHALSGAGVRRDAEALRCALVAAHYLGNDGLTSAVSRFVEKSGSVEVPQQVSAGANGFGAVVLRVVEAKLLDGYFAASRRVDVSADAAYLAGELTYHPAWYLMLESPVHIRIGRRNVAIRSASFSIGTESLEIRFQKSAAGPTIPRVVIPLSGARAYVAGTAEHAAAVIVDLLFSSGERLQKTHAAADKALVETLIGEVKTSASSIYRLSSSPDWNVSTLSGSFLSVTGRSGVAQVPHDRRGHFQIRNGKQVPIRAYRTGKDRR